MAGYDAEIRIGTKVDSSQMQRLQMQIDKTANKIAMLSTKYEELKNKKIPTDDFLAVQKQIDETQTRLNSLLAKKDTFQGKRKSATWLNMNAEIDELEKSLPYLQGEMQDLVDTGKAFTLGRDTEEFRNTAKDITLAESELRALLTKQGELGVKQSKVSDGLKRIGDASKKTFGGMHKDVKKTSGLFSTFAARLKGIALSLLIFNWISKAFNSMVTGIKEGFKNLVKYSDDYNKSISMLKSVNTQLKNSFAAAFAPIIQMAIPHLITLINYLTAAANKVAQFMAVLTGKSTWIKATSVQENYADSLNGTASAAKKAMGALASFDSLEVLSKKDTSDGGSGGAKPGDMFEEVSVEQDTSDAVKNLKEWLEKLKEAAEPTLEAMKKLWDEGLSKLKDFTFATLLDFYNNFLVPVGKWALGEGLPRFFNVTNDLLNEIDWERLRTSLGGFYTALGKLTIVTFDALLDFYEYFLKPLAVWTMSEAIPQLVDIMTDFINEVDWEKINKSLEKFWKAIEPYAEQFGQGLIDFFSALKDIGVDIMNSIPMVLDGITKALNEGDPEEAKKWGYALGAIATAFMALNLANKGFGAVLETFKSLKSLMPYILFAVSIWETMPESLKFPEAPKEEDYKSFEEYNVALENYHGQLDKIMEDSAESLKIPGVEYDEDDLNASLVEIYNKLVTWGDDIDNLVLGDKIGGAFEGTWTDTGKRFAEWWTTDVAPWFTAERWYALGQGILDGLLLKWQEIKEWWAASTLALWWEEDVAPWFDAGTWAALAKGILDGISEKWSEVVTWWDTNIGAWWDENVAPWFTVERWKKLGEGMKKGIYNGFWGIVSKVTDVVNGIISACEGMINFMIDKINELVQKAASLVNSVPGISLSISGMDHIKFERVKAPQIPALANGAVLRGGNPMLAILNDQPRGQTNVEAPVSVIEEAVRNGTSGNRGGGDFTLNMNYDGETFARVFIKDFLSEMNRQGYDVDILGGLT